MDVFYIHSSMLAFTSFISDMFCILCDSDMHIFILKFIAVPFTECNCIRIICQQWYIVLKLVYPHKY